MKNPALHRPYRNHARRILLILDLRSPGAAERLRWLPRVWCGEVVVEKLDENHVLLALAPGGASRRARI